MTMEEGFEKKGMTEKKFSLNLCEQEKEPISLM
jgi:hypothetical protein